MASNPLVNTTKSSEQAVQLHPLILLTISDHVTRHTLRNQPGPIVGAIIGTQHGRDITMEHAFECKIDQSSDGESQVLDQDWFSDRLQQYRDVHKTPALDLVGWFTLAPTSGPQPVHVSMHRQLATYNESILFLAFHASPLLEESSKGDKLPLTIFEPVVETGLDDNGDKTMSESGESGPAMLRFSELPYSVETGDAEMIAVDFVARGGANAAAIPTTSQTDFETSAASKSNGREKDTDEVSNDESRLEQLTAEEEDLIATMKSKSNAILMLKQRVSLIKSYLDSLPPSYLNDASITACESHAQISQPILRSIASLLARLPLLVPYTPLSKKEVSAADASLTSVYEKESMAQASDVALISLLGQLGSTIDSAQTMYRKANLVESATNSSREKSRMATAMDLEDVQYGDSQDWPEGLESESGGW